ncbi:MAG: AAA family ATPase [Anaerolineales bacterium]|nr:AAA family ATPase [Anaerolineales bacterium]
MQNILLVVGSPASGKSTISQAIATRSAKGVHIPVDDLRTMVQGGVLHPGPNWTPELIHQLKLARQTATDMALRYREADFLVAIDDFGIRFRNCRSTLHSSISQISPQLFSSQSYPLS